MKSKISEQAIAVTLRKQGKTYKEILEILPVAKSSLSLWLGKLPLTDEEKKYLKHRKDSNISRGRISAATAHRRHRLESETELRRETKIFFDERKTDPFFILGITLYWAEGAKRNTFFSFTNSDPAMVRLMLRWCEVYFSTVKKTDVIPRLYIHKAYIHEQCEKHWSSILSIPESQFAKTIIKPDSKLYKKRPNYKGCLRLQLRKMLPFKKMLFLLDFLVDEYSK